MIILTIRTDKPEAEIGLFDAHGKLAYALWEAHRELSVQLHRNIEALLQTQDKQLADVRGVVCFAGPGSFTGLRIGLSVGNALAYGLGVPVVASKGDDWIEQGCARLERGEQDTIALPVYGAPVHITKPTK